MNEPVTHEHLHQHTSKLTLVVVIAILILAGGEYYLYRQQLQIKSMVSEGLFQLKDQINATPTSSLTPTLSPNKY